MRRAGDFALVVVLVLHAAPAAAQIIPSTNYLVAPENLEILWLKVGFTSERRLFFGASFEHALTIGAAHGAPLSSVAAGVEVSPRSALASIRLVATLNGAVALGLSARCAAYFIGASAGPVVAFGPRGTRAGLRLGGRLAFVPMVNASTPTTLQPVQTSSLATAVGLPYGYSWLPGAGDVHDFSVELGPAWTWGGYCGDID